MTALETSADRRCSGECRFDGTLARVTDAATGSSDTEAASRLSSHQILTAPNAFTLLRLCCIPLFLYLLFGRDNVAGAAWLLGGLGATDWVDGWLARRFNQVSEFGKIFDPTADRLLFIVAIAGIIVKGIPPIWFAWAVVGREVVVGATMAIATLVFKMRRFDVTYLGKLATFLLMFAIPGFMLGSTDIVGHQVFLVASWLLGVPGLLISYYTAFAYIPLIRNGIRAGRSGSV
ncbi:MAG: CDP-diacylglycerol--glycerol-3-phosphate 3-phosphatidyltransferase [Actinomycetota bacterium]